MKSRKKQLVTTALAFSVACTNLQARETHMKDKVLGGSVKSAAYMPVNRKVKEDGANKYVLPAFALTLALVGAYGIHKYSTAGEKNKNTDELNKNVNDKVDGSFSGPAAGAIDEGIFCDKEDPLYAEDITAYAKRLAERRYILTNEWSVSDEELGKYLGQVHSLYDAAMRLCADLSYTTETEKYNAAVVLLKIIDAMRRIPGIEKIPTPERQIAYYILSQFKGSYDDVKARVTVIEKNRPDLFPDKLMFSLLHDVSFFDYERRCDLSKQLLREPLRMEKRGDDYIFISECCIIPGEPNGLGTDRLELTVSPDNRKTLTYVYKSPCTRDRNCDLRYDIK